MVLFNCLNMYGVPDFYQNDNVKKGTGMQWRHQVVSDLPKNSKDYSDRKFSDTLNQNQNNVYLVCRYRYNVKVI